MPAALQLASEPIAPGPSSLYRVFWRWHFYAGVLVGPVLFVVAVTGALYIFKDELERVIHADMMFVTPQTEALPMDRQMTLVAEAFPDWRVDTVEVESDPTRATSIRIRDRASQSQRVYVNPHTGKIQGALGEDSFFRVVLSIHRRLFIGTTGRIVVECVTCWTIILLVTGLYLWFPRRREKLKGVLLPRLQAKRYTVLRDLHAISGALLMPVALTMVGTGLLYTWGWGSLYQYASAASEGETGKRPSTSAPNAPRLSMDRAIAIARERAPDASLIDVQIPTAPHAPLVARARIGERAGPRNRVVLTLDRSTGEVLAMKTSDQFPLLGWWRSKWNYPLHVGSVLGTTTKVLWLLACLVLAMLPVFGFWMWWQRRPEGRSGFPRRPDRSVPRWLVVLIAVFSLVLPAVGATILLIGLGEWMLRRVRSRKAATGPQSI
ncbi:MAG: PepSY domain-containing protein [Planctomycetaceae bacterium]|nr:PepSY domain-containing protein [Planctomycetaceae bacterium]